MQVLKNTIDAQLISNNVLHHMCVKLLNDQGFSDSEAKKIIEVEIYLLGPRDMREILNQVNQHEHTLEHAMIQFLNKKQRRYFLALLQQFLEAQVLKYTENLKPSSFLY